MAQQLVCRGDVLDELEDHLRNEIEEMTRSGCPAEAALDAAMTRLGAPAALAEEFSKVPPPYAPWLPVRLALVGGAALAAMMVAPLWPRLVAGGVATLLATHMGLVMLGYLSTLMVGSLAACYFLARPFRNLSEGQARTLKRASLILTGAAVALTGVGILFGSLFCPNEKTGWALGLDSREVGGLVILAFNVAMFSTFWRSRQSERLKGLMLLGLAGNATVVLGWLGASAFERQLQGEASDYTLVIALLLAQLGAAALAFAPAGRLRIRQP